jgi:hypothetical protein
MAVIAENALSVKLRFHRDRTRHKNRQHKYTVEFLDYINPTSRDQSAIPALSLKSRLHRDPAWRAGHSDEKQHGRLKANVPPKSRLSNFYTI